MLEILYSVFIFPLEQVIDWALFTLFKATKSYGVSIILLAFVIQLFMLNITLYFDGKAIIFHSLKDQCDTKIKEFKRVFKGAELQSYIRTLYKQKHFHPIFALFNLGGLALQIPFFIAMIHLVENAEYLQSISFLWIDDLSKPDSITLFDIQIHVLPILMTAFTLINVFYSSEEKSARIQGSLIALLFLVLLYNMPSALVLYWTCNMGFALFKEIFKRYRNKRHQTTENDTNKNMPLEVVTANRVTTASNHTQHKFLLNNKMVYTETEVHAVIDTQHAALQKNSSFKQFVSSVFAPYIALDSKTYKFYRDVSILAILNICFMICVFSPYAIYSSDVSQFDISQTYQTLAVLFGSFLCSSFIITYITSFFYKTRLFKFGVYVVSTLLLMGIINTFIFVGDYGTMDHFILQKPKFDNPNNLLYALCTFIVSVIVVYFCFKWLKTFFSVVFATLCILSIMSVYKIVEANKTYITPKIIQDGSLQPYEKELFSYSKNEKNIVVFVLDMFSGSHMRPLLTQFPEFKTQLDGFVLFDNAISTTNSTIHSIATIIGGEYYSVYNMNARKDILADSITEAFGVIGDTFVKNGYSVGYFMGDWAKEQRYLQAYNEQMFIVQNGHTYIDYYLMRHPEDAIALQLANEGNSAIYKRLLSYAVFRFSPEILRHKVYNNGEWLRHKIIDYNVKTSLPYASSFYAFTHLHNTESKKPTFKYLHSLMTHVPYGMYYDGKTCKFQSVENKLSAKTAWKDYSHKTEMSYRNEAEKRLYFKHYDSEACALSYLDTFIQWLKDNNIYDNTQIFVVSDHGGFDSIGIPNDVVMKEGRPDVLFLFKDFNASGELKLDSRLMANYDISSIFCSNLPHGCPNVPNNILQRNIKDRFIIQATPISAGLEQHKVNEWLISHYFRVKGNIYDENNWQDITREVKNNVLKIDGIAH